MEFDDYDFEVSWLITEARLNAGLTQAALARKIGTKQSAICRAERGAVLPSHKLLKKIAKAIGTTLLPPKFAYMGPFASKISFNTDAHTTTTVMSF